MIILKILMLLVTSLILSILAIVVFFYLVRRSFVVINDLTPNIDEIKEILRGNTAVSEYFSRLLSSTIIAISIILSVILIISFELIR